MTTIDTFWFASNKTCAVDADCEWTEYCSVAVHGGLCVCPWSADLRGAGCREKGPNFWYSVVWRTLVLLVYSWLLVYAVRCYLKINSHFNRSRRQTFPVICVIVCASIYIFVNLWAEFSREVIGSYRPASTLVYWSFQLLGVYVGQLSALQVILSWLDTAACSTTFASSVHQLIHVRRGILSVTIASTVVIVACVIMLFTALRDVGRIVCYIYMLLNSIVLVVLLELGHRQLSTLIARSVAINSGVLSELSATARQVIKEVHGPSLTAGSERITDSTSIEMRRLTLIVDTARRARTSLLMFCLSVALYMVFDLVVRNIWIFWPLTTASYITIVPMLAAICQSQERASHPAMSIAATAVGLQATLAEDPEAAAPRLSAEGSASLKTRDAGAAAVLGDDQAVTIEQKLKLGVASSTKALPVEPKRWTDPRRTEGSAASHASQV